MGNRALSRLIDFPDPLVSEAYWQCAENNILAALNPKVRFGYFSVCADGQGHGGNTTFPGLDWGQQLEALLWLGREQEVLASWDYVSSFQREDGLLPFAILPDLAGKTLTSSSYPLHVEANGGVYKHWVPGNPLRTLANVTYLLTASAIFRHIHDLEWLIQQKPLILKAVEWLLAQVTPEGMVSGGGFYVERPTRLEYDGINQCYTVHAFRETACLLESVGAGCLAQTCHQSADKITHVFQEQFWVGDHFIEYIHPERGPISHHGCTDVDWAIKGTDTF